MAITQDELGNYYDDSDYITTTDNSQPIARSMTTGTNMPSVDEDFSPTYPITGGGSGITDALKSVFGGANAVRNASVMAGGIAGATGLLDKNQKRSGYQGSIPQLQAVRNMVTAPPSTLTGYRPGQGGVKWNSDVFYAPKGSVPTSLTGSMTPADQVAAANAARANASKSNSTLNTLAKVAGATGIASLLSNVLGKNTNLTGLVDKAGNLTTAGINTLTNALKGVTAGGGLPGGSRPGGVTPKGSTSTGGGGGGTSGVGETSAEGADEELTTPEGEYAGEDEFSGIDEQIAANENDLETPNVLTDEEIDEELARVNAETDADYGTGVDDTVVDFDADQGLTRSMGGGDSGVNLDDYYDYTSDMSDVDYSDVDYSGFDFGSNDLDLSDFDLNYSDDYSNFDFGGGDDYSFDFGDFAKGGAINMAKGRYLRGNTDGMADKLPARIGQKQPAALSHGEFVVPADVVSHLGNGNSDAGAKKLYQMMDKIRVARTGNKKQGKQINPDKFMPGGLAQAYAQGGSVKHFVTGGTTGATGKDLSSLATAGITGSETSPNTFAGDYMANMLGKTQALTETPYQQYMGPLTAGASPLQQKTFEGLQSVNFPSNLGQSFSSAGAPTMGADGKPVGGAGIASQYMNPYLQSVLQPQLEELRRTSQINLQPGLAKMTQAGGYGGGRQAIMESEANRNLLQEQNKTVGQGYANAYDKAMGQFNTEQGQAKTLVDMFGTQGANQRTIEAEGIAADKKSFEEARENPYNMLTFQQSMLNGLPISATSYDLSQPSTLAKTAQGAVTVDQLLKTLGLTK
jgi:hypothetical protein